MSGPQSKWKDRLLFVFTDKFMVFWLILAAGGIGVFRFNKAIGFLLCLPAILFYTIAFVGIVVSNHRRKTGRK